MKTAVYAGSFDPVTNGHLDVVMRATEVFDRLLVGVLENPRKAPLLAVHERVALIRAAVDAVADPATAARVDAQAFDGLTVEFCRRSGARFLVRGLRVISDFENEIQLAHNNRRLAPEIDTVFFMTALQHGYVSSSLVKEIARFGGDVSAMVPEAVREALVEALGGR